MLIPMVLRFRSKHLMKGKKVKALGLFTYVLLKHNHVQLQSSISRQWFTRKTLLNKHDLTVACHAIVLDNPALRLAISLTKRKYIY